jgi:hypothetical protein
VPDSLGVSLKEFAKHENISMNQLITTAIAKKLSALKTYDYLQERSDKGSSEHLLEMLKKVPSRETSQSNSPVSHNVRLQEAKIGLMHTKALRVSSNMLHFVLKFKNFIINLLHISYI